MHDFQFFNREELGELVQEEERLEQRRKDAQSLARELKQKGKKAQDEANAKAKAAGQEPSPCPEAEAHLQQSREVAKELEKGSSYELTGAKLEKKEQLLREGFVDWTRKDFRSFLNAMERRGRDEVDVIARETSNETGKTEEEVRRGVLELPRHRRDGYIYTYIYDLYTIYICVI